MAEVRERLPDPPSYSAVRAMLRILEDKGQLHHEQDGPRYVFLPTVPREQARASALRGLVRTFFNGSPEGAVAALLDLGADELDDEALTEAGELSADSARPIDDHRAPKAYRVELVKVLARRALVKAAERARP